MMLAAATGTGAAGIKYGSQEAEAIAPAIVGIAAGTAWLLRDYEIIGADDPPEGLTASALRQHVLEKVRTRKSFIDSTFVDNGNLLDGMEDTAYIDGKIAAIEALNDQLTEQEVQDAATEVVDDYQTTVEKNLLNSWNEAMSEMRNIFSSLDGHGDTSVTDMFGYKNHYSTGLTSYSIKLDADSYTFPNDDTISLHNIDLHDDPDMFGEWNPIAPADGDGDWHELTFDHDGYSTSLFNNELWGDFMTEVGTLFDNVRNGLITYVSTVYSDVQSGEIEISELITARDRAQMMADEEDQANAVSDLIALNMHVDLNREATISLSGTAAEIRGSFIRTANPEGEPLEAGETYDPASLEGDLYFSYDVAEGQGTWSDYEENVDGGIVTFTSEPYAETEFVINTGDEESVSVETAEFNDEGDGTYTVDISPEVENAITTVASVDYYGSTDGSQYETILLEDEFEILKFENDDGEEVDSANFEQSSEPQTADNFVTQEEFDNWDAKTQELIDKYEESQQTAGGGGGFWPDNPFGDLPGAGAIAIVVGLIALLVGTNS